MSMPRPFRLPLLLAVVGATAVVLLPAPGASADPHLRPNAVLERADAVFAGAAGPTSRRDASMVLRDVFVARPTMDDADRWRAERLLARPTDRAGDPYGDGYRVPATRVCGGPVCVHYVPTTRDAPPSHQWVRTTLKVMRRVWDTEVHRMGYRRPPRDGRHGGDSRFDVYLEDLGRQGLFGYCAPEYRVRGLRHVASGYCVLDDDFARSQYGVSPRVGLRVTAAHEFFHAVQFGYDFREDPWLLESTASWMEERAADRANDNRRYLRYGQVAQPGVSLDRFDPAGYGQYGNWVFWEYLSQRFGPDVVRDVWRRAAALPGSPDRFSVAALRRALADRGGLRPTFGAYAAALAQPARTFPEGGAWPRADIGSGRLGADRTHARTRVRVNHLASRSIAVQPARGLRGGWLLELIVDGPPRVTAPAAYVQVVARDGSVRARPVALDRQGVGRARMRFDATRVRKVVVTLANASTRYRCRTGGATYACNGAPRDQRLPFEVTARIWR
jgi:hypothetical protein